MKDSLFDILELAKMLKSHYVYYNPEAHKLIGTDYHMTYIKVMDIPEIQYRVPLFFDNKEVQKFSKTTDNEYAILEFMETSIRPMKYLYDKVEEIYYKTINFTLDINTTNTLTIDNIRGNQSFENSLSLKSAQGIGYFYIGDQYIMTIFSGLLPINKSDEVALKIYDNKTLGTFLANFTIKKKKKADINVFINYLKLVQ